MSKVFFKCFFVSIIVCSFFIVHNIEAKTHAKLSKKYVPFRNPGGVEFYKDEEFAKSYELYEKRRESLRKRKLKMQDNVTISKKILIRKLQDKKIIRVPSQQKACVEDNGEDAMLNKDGINLACLKGAILIPDEN